MNYIIEGGIDFYSEINKKEEEVDTNEEKCLITYQPLMVNYIKLSCGHKFNYLSIYKEICNQKKNLPNVISFNPVRLLINEIRCPYCRLKINELLPYIPQLDENGVHLIERTNGVNSPERFCMKICDCEWKFKYRKEEGTMCTKNAYYLNEGNPHAYCDMHWKKIDVKKLNNEKKIEKKINNAKVLKEKEDIWTVEMISYSKTKSVEELKDILSKNGLIKRGNKKEMVQRIFENNKNI